MTIPCTVTITAKETLTEIPNTWQTTDYRAILDACGFAEGDTLPDAEAAEMALMALADLPPAEAANVLLTHRLSDELNEGQIDQISHDMQNDKIFEEYPEIGLHRHLFDANQLLRKAYNGKFPNGEAVQARATLHFSAGTLTAPEQLTAALVLKALAPGLSDHSLIKRLYADELAGEKPFTDAEAIVWEMNVATTPTPGSFDVQLLSSEYWLHDLADQAEFETQIIEPESEEDV